MKRRNIYLPASLILTAVLDIPAVAQTQVPPFKGTFQGTDCVFPENTCSTDNSPTIKTSGTGVGTHMGAFSLTQETTLIPIAPNAFAGSAHWVAANGDSIDSTFIASPDFSTAPLGYITVTETHTITGGTGRFAGAQGSFILKRTHLTTLSADGTHVTFGSFFHGSITPPGATH